MERIITVKTSDDLHTNTQDVEVIDSPIGMTTVCGIPVSIEDGNVFIDNQLFGKEIINDIP